MTSVIVPTFMDVIDKCQSNRLNYNVMNKPIKAFPKEEVMANVGLVDRLLRAVVGVVLLALPFVSAPAEGGGMAYGVYGWIMIAAGIVMLVTAALRFCPLYKLFGLRTCPISK